jgi:hypothetical protein
MLSYAVVCCRNSITPNPPGPLGLHLTAHSPRTAQVGANRSKSAKVTLSIVCRLAFHVIARRGSACTRRDQFKLGLYSCTGPVFCDAGSSGRIPFKSVLYRFGRFLLPSLEVGLLLSTVERFLHQRASRMPPAYRAKPDAASSFFAFRQGGSLDRTC